MGNTSLTPSEATARRPRPGPHRLASLREPPGPRHPPASAGPEPSGESHEPPRDPSADRGGLSPLPGSLPAEAAPRGRAGAGPGSAPPELGGAAVSLATAAAVSLATAVAAR